LNDANNGFNVTVVIFATACFCLLNSFSFIWKNSGVFTTQIAYIIAKYIKNPIGLEKV